MNTPTRQSSGPSPHRQTHLPPLESAPQWPRPSAGIPQPDTPPAPMATHRESRPVESASEFEITPVQLGNVVNFDERTSTEQTKLLNSKYGGVEGLAISLHTHLETGLHVLNSNSVIVTDSAVRQQMFGINLIPPPPSKGILRMIMENIIEDTIIKILILGAFVTIVVGAIVGEGWYDGLAILAAVIIVLSVTAGNDFSKDKKFKKLLLLQSDKKTKVVRGGRRDQVSSWDLLVGDVIELATGDEIPADGVFIRGNRLVVDESPLTGESLAVKKSAKTPFLFSGCQVSEGTGFMLVTAVGSRSSGGKIQTLLSEAQGDETVLQMKLGTLAMQIGKIGFAAGVITFLALSIRFTVDMAQKYTISTIPSERLMQLLRFFNVSVTIIVVAVPEGLPLAVTISLAFSMFKMIKDRCFVRHLEASETMGEATAICTDKTGTLTENRMTVVKSLVGRKLVHAEGSGELDATPLKADLFGDIVREVMIESICINSSCFIKYKSRDSLPLFVGSATEGALLVMAQKLGYDYDHVRKQAHKIENGEYLFTSDRKRMSTLCEPRVPAWPMAPLPPFRLYTKGASEIVLELCTHQYVESGTKVVPLTGQDRDQIQGTIKHWAGEGLRTLALAYREFDQPLTRAEREDPENNLVFLGLVGIKDPVRPRVPEAVKLCQEAGIIVRMVTGDNVLTACKIARECHILKDHGVAMEGPVFRDLSVADKKAIIPKLQVLARSSPADKHTLVSLLKEMGEVVAVTGDGTNDAPALKEADVGFAMGISGTQISMNASDIILLDDNFVSIVQSIKWGRNVLNVVRQFIQFQLAVNTGAVILTIIGSAVNDEPPLSSVQLLWVNLIMDTFGALALASDVPDPSLLKQRPHRRNDSILTRPMVVYIFVVALYQIVVLAVLLFTMGNTLYETMGGTLDKKRWVLTLIFTTFVLMQVVNLVLARQLKFELNFLRGTTKNPLMPIMIVIILLIQIIMVQLAGTFVGTVALNAQEWAVCAGLALGTVPYMLLIRGIAHYTKNYRVSVKFQITHAIDDDQPPDPVKSETKRGSKIPLVTKTTHIIASSDITRSPAALDD